MIVESQHIIIMTQEPVNESDIRIDSSTLTDEEFRRIYKEVTRNKQTIFYITKGGTD